MLSLSSLKPLNQIILQTSECVLALMVVAVEEGVGLTAQLS